MAENFASLVAQQIITNSKLEELNKNAMDDNSPRNRILDALPEVLGGESIAKREKIQRASLQKADEKAESEANKRSLESNKNVANSIGKMPVELSKEFQNHMRAPGWSRSIKDLQRTMIKGFGEDKKIQKVIAINAKARAIEQTMLEQVAAFDALGRDATKTREYQKNQTKLMEAQYKADKLVGSATTEDKEKLEAQQKKSAGVLGKIGFFMKGIFDTGKEKKLGGFKGIGKFLFGAFLIAVLAFLSDPRFEEMKNRLLKVVIPMVAKVLDLVILIGAYLGGKILDAFESIEEALKPGGSWLKALGDNKLVVASIAAYLLGFKRTFRILSFLIGAALSLFSVVGFGALAALLIPIAGILGILAGAIAITTLIMTFLAAWGPAVKDAEKEYEAGGTKWQVLKTFFSSLLGNWIGILGNLIKDGVSYVLLKLGEVFGFESFIEASKTLDKIDFVGEMKDIFGKLNEAISLFFEKIAEKIESGARTLLSLVGKSEEGDKIFGTKEQKATERALKRGFFQESFSGINTFGDREKRAAERAANKEQFAQKKRFQDALTDQEKVLNNRLRIRRKNIELKVPGVEAVDSFGIVNAPVTTLSSYSTSQSFTNTNMTNGNQVVNMLTSAIFT